MKPRGPLMIEHRLIEKVLTVAKRRAESMAEKDYNPVFIETIVDFIRTYSDRTHHGKEEEILFAALRKKQLDEENSRLMAELIEEHKQSRAKVREIAELNEQYKRGNAGVVLQIVEIVLWLAAFYPAHIKKEDAVFFPHTERYFSNEEMDDILRQFWEFDRKMIHEKYKRVYESISSTNTSP
jgi:hemerythrin-like domain-containing protein